MSTLLGVKEAGGKRDRDIEGEKEAETQKETDRQTERALAVVSSFKDTNLSDQGPSLMASFKLSYFLIGPISKYNHIRV